MSNKIQMRAEDLRPGMYLETWFGTHMITEIAPYTGPFDFVIGIANFPGKRVGMSLEKGSLYDIIAPEDCGPQEPPQEPPQDPRIFNRRQPDGSFRPLSEFFKA